MNFFSFRQDIKLDGNLEKKNHDSDSASLALSQGCLQDVLKSTDFQVEYISTEEDSFTRNGNKPFCYRFQVKSKCRNYLYHPSHEVLRVARVQHQTNHQSKPTHINLN
jgi:hypothetical protein